MRSDRYTKSVLTAIAIGLWGLMLTQLGPPTLARQAEASVSGQSVPDYMQQKRGGGETTKAVAPTLPLRWRTGYAHDAQDGIYKVYCVTVVSVRNLSSATVDVDVEWVDWTGGQHALRRLSLSPKVMLQWVTSAGVDILPHYGDDTAGISGFIGFANIYASDPKILASSVLVCRDGTAVGDPMYAHDQIPAYPVGATMEYFQAGMPATWTPPMVAPEIPE